MPGSNPKFKLSLQCTVMEISARREIASEKFDGVKDSIVARDEQENWYEQEADEVGFEFYLKAGFEPTLYQWAKPGAVPDFDLAKCRAKIKLGATDPAQLPRRGSGSHPDYCWRLYDIEVLEGKRHREDYAELRKGAVTVNLYRGELERLQKSLK